MILCKWTNDVINRENKNILPVEGNHLKEILEETSWVSFFMAEKHEKRRKNIIDNNSILQFWGVYSGAS